MQDTLKKNPNAQSSVYLAWEERLHDIHVFGSLYLLSNLCQERGFILVQRRLNFFRDWIY